MFSLVLEKYDGCQATSQNSDAQTWTLAMWEAALEVPAASFNK